MGVTVRRNFASLDTLPIGPSRDDWGRIGRLARERVIRRTLAGRDERDAPFQPYSRGYAAVKTALGASPAVNLQLSGEMLRAITVIPDATGVTLAFSN
jgi:hypothetical protein